MKAELISHVRMNNLHPPKCYFEPGVRLVRNQRQPVPILSKTDLRAYITRLRTANGPEPGPIPAAVQTREQMDTT